MAGKGRKSVEEISIRPLDKGTGVISNTRTKTARGGSGGGPDYDYDHEEVHHPTMEHLEGHLREHLKGVFGKSEGEPIKGTSTKEEPSAEE